MTFKKRMYFVVFVLLGLFAELVFLGYLATQVLESDAPSKKDFFPVSLPETNHTDLQGADDLREGGLSWTYN